MATEAELIAQIEQAAAASQLAADIGNAAAAIISQIAHGDENAIVNTDNGPVPSLARWLALMALQLESDFSTDLVNKLNKSGDVGTVKSLSAEQFDNGENGTVVGLIDYTDGEDQILTLTSPGTVISFTNIPLGAKCFLTLKAGATYAPDLTGLAPWLGSNEPVLDAVNVIGAENLDGTIRYFDGGSYAS